jgi:hypothetical protein
MIRFSTLRTLAFGASVALTAGACAEAPTQPQTPSAPSIAASVVSTGGLDFSHELGDIRTRILPGFASQDAATSLQAEMDAIGQRVAAGDVEGARAAIARARLVVQQPGATSAADAYAIGRTLDVIDGVLQ